MKDSYREYMCRQEAGNGLHCDVHAELKSDLWVQYHLAERDIMKGSVLGFVLRLMHHDVCTCLC